MPIVLVNQGRELRQGDAVEGYTIKEIELVMREADSWNKWRDLMISRYNNSTEGNLNALFRTWQ